MKFVIVLCIFAAIFAGSVYFGYLYITPSSYVTLDSNPRVEFSLNTFDRVIKVKTDDENTSTINKLKLNNMEITEAVQKTIDELEWQGYISNNSSLIIFVSNKDESKISNIIGKLNEKTKIDVEGNYEIEMVKVEYPIK